MTPQQVFDKMAFLVRKMNSSSDENICLSYDNTKETDNHYYITTLNIPEYVQIKYEFTIRCVHVIDNGLMFGADALI